MAKRQDDEEYRHLPYDVVVEQSLLGSLLLDNSQLETIAPLLRWDQFFDPLHQRIFRFMAERRIAEPHRAITPLVLHAALKADPGLAELGGLNYLSSLALAAPALANPRDLASIITELSARRQMIIVGNDMMELSYLPPHERPTERILVQAQGDIETLFDDWQRASGRQAAQSAYDIGVEVVSNLEAVAAGERSRWKVPTGLASIDDVIGGLEPADFTTICGRSGNGKSALMGGIAWRAARGTVLIDGQTTNQIPVIVFSLEMRKHQWIERTLCDIDFDTAVHPLWYSKFRNNRFTPAEVSRIAEANYRLSQVPLEICDDGALTVEDIGARARAFKARHSEAPIGLIVVDYLQKVQPTPGRDRSREQEVSYVASGLKNLGKALDWPVMAGVQLLTKGVESGGQEKPPILKDIRESGNIEIESDFAFMCHRKARALLTQKPENVDRESAEYVTWQASMRQVEHDFQIFARKNRHGEEFDVSLWCDMPASAIRDQKPSAQFTAREQNLQEMLPWHQGKS